MLAIRSLKRLLTGTAYADVIAVPFVMLDGAPLPLERSRLVDLRVYPDYRSISIQFTGYGEADFPARTRTLFGSAYDPGLSMQAIYDLGDNRYAFVKLTGAHFADVPAFIPTRATIVSLASGRRVASAPVEYLEIPFSGPISYNGETKVSEFSAPLDGNSPNATLLLGQRSFTGSAFTSSTNSDGDAPGRGCGGPN